MDTEPKVQSNKLAIKDEEEDNYEVAISGKSKSKNAVKESETSSEKSSSDDEDEKKENEPQLGYWELFRYATALDFFYLAIGVLSASAHGVAMPIMFIFFGEITNSFVDYGTYESCDFNLTICKGMGLVPLNTTIDEFNKLVEDSRDVEGVVGEQSVIFSILACAVWLFGWMQVTFFSLPAGRQIKRIRVLFFRSILRQNIGFFDTNSAGELNTRLADDVNKISDGMNDKVAMMIMNVTRAVGGLILGFVYSWKVSLVIFACSPFIGIISGILFKFIESFSKKENDAYAKAGGIAEEVLGPIDRKSVV